MERSFQDNLYYIIRRQVIIMLVTIILFYVFKMWVASFFNAQLNSMFFHLVSNYDLDEFSPNVIHRITSPNWGYLVFRVTNNDLEIIDSSLISFNFILVLFEILFLVMTCLMIIYIFKRNMSKINEQLSQINDHVDESLTNLSVIDPSYGVSELNQIADLSNRAVDKIRSSLEYQSHFKKVLTHEMRTPIQVIKGYNEINLVDSSSLSSQKIKRELYYLEYVITSVLESDIEYHIEKVNLVEFVNKIFTHYCDLDYVILEDCDIILNCDKNVLKQLLIILVDNLNKYALDVIKIKINSEHIEIKNSIKPHSSGTGIGLKNLKLLCSILDFDYQVTVDEYSYTTVLYFEKQNETL